MQRTNKTKINGNKMATKGTEVVADKSRLKTPLAEIRFCLFPISRQNLGEGNQSWETKHLSTWKFQISFSKYGDLFPHWKTASYDSPINIYIYPWNLVRSILGRRLELQGTRGLISWSGSTMAYTWMSSILSELSQITRESFTLLISSSWKGKVYYE